VERGMIHYGTSTGFFGERMFERGPSYLSAARSKSKACLSLV
jgi:Ca-activated chloride channel family protein